MTPTQRRAELQKQQQEAVDELSGLASGGRHMVTDEHGVIDDHTHARKDLLAERINELSDCIDKIQDA